VLSAGPRTTDPLAVVRAWILALVLVGTIGTGVELLLIEHYEDSWQLVPLCLIAAACAVTIWQAAAGGRGSLRALTVVMAAFVLAGLAGLVLHFRGNLEFQLELDASQSRWTLFTKVMRAKAPPALAPAVLSQLGVLGLLYVYCHPLARRGSDRRPSLHSRPHSPPEHTP
jgi:hypothetical protein